MTKIVRKCLPAAVFLLLILAMAAFLFAPTDVRAASSGSCGDGVSWTLSDDGVLTISGSGTMANYSTNSMPWYSSRNQIKQLVVQSGVTSIGKYAFYNCTALTSVSLPNGLLSISNDAFYNCAALVSITIPASVTSIGNYAFYSCDELESITLPEGLTTISNDTFAYCKTLNTIKIPSGVTSIGSSAFNNCSALESITLPQNLTKIGSSAFGYCTSLESITLPEGLTTIGQSCFTNCTAMTSITIPSTVTSIGYSAFKDSITSITFANGMTTIPNSACQSATKLTSVTIPSSVTSIGNYAFAYCDELQSITLPQDLTKISYDAFYHCDKLSSINIPSTVTSIGSSAFGYCTSLESITLPQGLTSIGSSAFNGCSAMSSITIPASVTSIGDSAFKGSITAITFAQGMTTIPNSACQSATKLSSVTIPSSVTSIGNYAFAYCDELTFVTLPQNLTKISYDAFYHCDKLSSINIPSTVTSIGSSAFGYCIALEGITLPQGLTTIGESCFTNCTAMSSITIPSSVTSIGQSAFKNGITSISFANGMTTIPNSACQSATKLTSVTIPSSVTSIGTYAFAYCDELTSVTLPQGLTKIGYDAFYHCDKLSSINIPSTVTSIGSSAFGYCIALGSIALPEGLSKINDSCFSNCTALSSINIPGSVKMLDNNCFYGCSSLESIALPEGLTSIGANVFRNCSSLNSVTVPSTVVDMGTYIFANGVKAVVFAEGMTTIPDQACYNANTLESVTIPATVTAIDDYAFAYCTAITEFKIGGVIESIAADAFYGCLISGNLSEDVSWRMDMQSQILHIEGKGEITLESADPDSAPWSMFASFIKGLYIADGISSVCEYAFYGLPYLGGVSLPESVATVGAYAFAQCSSLQRVELSEDLSSLGEGSFSGCDELETVILSSDAIDIKNSIPDKSEITIYYPKTATKWQVQLQDYANATIKTWDDTLPSRDIVLVLDISGSMSGSKIAALQTAAVQLVEKTGGRLSNTRFAVIAYNNEATLLCDYSTDVVLLSKQINSMKSGGQTVYYMALQAAQNLMASSTADICSMVMFSDGEPTDYVSDIRIKAADIRADYDVYSVGLSPNTSAEQLLIEIAGTKSHYFRAEDIESLIGVFVDLADNITTEKASTTASILRNDTESNLFAVMQSFAADSEESVKIFIMPYWGGAVAGHIALVQDGKEIITSSSGLFKDIAPGKLFEPFKAIYVRLMDKDGNTVLEKRLMLQITDGASSATANTSKYYGVGTDRLFRVMAVGSTYPSPAGFSVQVGNAEYSSGKTTCYNTDDIDVIVPAEYSGNITISREGYHSYSFPANLSGSYNVYTMMPSSVTTPFAQTLLLDKTSGSYVCYRNLLGESDMMYERGLTEAAQAYRLYPVINWNGHGEGTLWLQQGETKVPLTNNSWNSVELAAHFVAGSPVLLCAQAADGTKIQRRTQLAIYKKQNTGMPIDMGDKFTADTSKSEDVDILAGKSLKLDFSGLTSDLIPIEFTVSDDGNIEGVIGFTLDKGADKVAAFGNVKESFNEIKKIGNEAQQREIANLLDDMKQYGTPMPKSSSLGVEGKVQIIGYFTGNFLDNKTTLTEVYIALVFNGKISYAYNTTIPVMFVPVPAYFKIALEAEVAAGLAMAYSEDADCLMPNDDQSLRGKIAISGEAGPGWEGYASGGVKGRGTLKMNGPLPIDMDKNTWSVMADISFVGTLMGLEGEWVVYKTKELIFYQNGDFCSIIKGEDKTANFVPNLKRVYMQQMSSGSALVSGVSGYAQPQLVGLSDGRLLAVWLGDAAGRSDMDKNALFYAVRATDGSWSDVAMVEDDGTGDSVPQLALINDEAWLVWQNYTTVYGVDEFTAQNYDDLSAQMDIAVARFDSTKSVFTDITDLTLNGYDYLPQLGYSDRVVSAAWQHGTEDIYMAQLDSEGNWCQPEQLRVQPAWYEESLSLPDDYPTEWPSSSTARQVLQLDANRTAVLYTAPTEAGISNVFALVNDGSGWGDPVQLTDEKSGMVRAFRACTCEGKLVIIYNYDPAGDLSLPVQLRCIEPKMDTDLSIYRTDYVRMTLVPEEDLTLQVGLKNVGLKAIYGVNISVTNNGTEVVNQDFDLGLLPGQAQTVYVNYLLPADISTLSALNIKVTPLSEDDVDKSDNSSVCNIITTDLSLEKLTATRTDSATHTILQIVSRGSTATEAATLTYHRGTPDGEVVATTNIPALQPGEMLNLSTEINVALPEGEMIYVEAESSGSENMLYNNSTQCVVKEPESSQLSVQAVASSADGGTAMKLSVQLSNNTSTEVAPLVMAAVYDVTTGKMLSYQLVNDQSMAAISSLQKELVFDLPAAGTLNYKVFVLEPGSYKPLMPNISGSYSAAVE